jgi:hypothetical protein
MASPTSRCSIPTRILVFSSVRALVAAIEDCVDENNQQPKPFGTAKARDPLATVPRVTAALADDSA